MDARFTTYDPNAAGSKGLIYIGDKLLLYRRNTKTDLHPLDIDLPGGGPEGTETPFETWQREIKEEYGLTITPADIAACYPYSSQSRPGRTGYFFVVYFPEATAKKIVFDYAEGTEYLLLTPAEYLARTDAWEYIRNIARRYLEPAK